jgi:adenylate kinase
VLFDGYPRTLAQAEALEGNLRDLGRKLDRVVDFRAPDASLVERLSGRRTCSRCHAAYHVKFAPSKKGAQCEKCGEALVQRTDDLPETITKRLEVYRKDTAGVGERFRAAGIYEEIDADRPIDAVTKDVMERVGKAK